MNEATNVNIVDVPETECLISDADLEELYTNNIDPLAQSTQHGIDIYEKVLEFLEQKF